MKPQPKRAALHAIGHTARIAATLKRRPAHPRLAEYDHSLIKHHATWLTLTDAEKGEVRDAFLAALPADLTAADVDAAITTLEG